MKQFLLVILITFFNAKIQAQVVFCPAGAEWHYLYNSDNLSPRPDYTNEEVKCTGETIVNGETLKSLWHLKIFRMYNVGFPSNSLLKQHGDTVFLKSSFTNNQWCVLFNFAAQPGDSWIIHLSIAGNTSYTVTVDSVNTVTVAGQPLKRVFASYNQNNFRFYHAQFTERLGGSHFFFNFLSGNSSDGDFMTETLCYADSALGEVKFSSKPCDFSNLNAIAEFNHDEQNIHLYPNPATDLLNFKTNYSAELTLSLSDISGREILRTKVIRSGQIDLNGLSSGLYFVKITDEEQLFHTEKILKQ